MWAGGYKVLLEVYMRPSIQSWGKRYTIPRILAKSSMDSKSASPEVSG